MDEYPADEGHEQRLINLRRALQNLGESAPAGTRLQLEAMLREAEEEDRRRQVSLSTRAIDWRRYLEPLRDQLATQARIFVDLTVTGKELPGLSGLLPDAARF